MLRALYALRSMSNPEPPALTDFPEGLVSGSSAGAELLPAIHTKADIWNMTEMEEFVRQLRPSMTNCTR